MILLVVSKYLFTSVCSVCCGGLHFKASFFQKKSHFQKVPVQYGAETIDNFHVGLMSHVPTKLWNLFRGLLYSIIMVAGRRRLWRESVRSGWQQKNSDKCLQQIQPPVELLDVDETWLTLWDLTLLSPTKPSNEIISRDRYDDLVS